MFILISASVFMHVNQIKWFHISSQLCHEGMMLKAAKNTNNCYDALTRRRGEENNNFVPSAELHSAWSHMLDKAKI